jgi:hypothetical protein
MGEFARLKAFLTFSYNLNIFQIRKDLKFMWKGSVNAFKDLNGLYKPGLWLTFW